MSREPVAIGTLIGAVLTLIAVFYPDVTGAIDEAGGTTAVVGAVVTIYALIGAVVRSRVSPE